MSTTPRRSARHRPPARGLVAVVVVAAAVAAAALLLGGCGGAAEPSRATAGPGTPAATTTPARPSPPPAPSADALAEVPVRSADLAAAAPAAQGPAPTRLRLDALGIDIPLDAVGVAEDGQMEIPPMAERGGWYRFGATPGDAVGTVVIAAHVDSVASAGLGPFAALRDAEPGQTAVVDLADGTQVTYAVASVAAQPKPDVAWTDVFDRAGPPRLVLVTCGGTWRSEVRSYSDNVLVTAVPADG